MHCFCSRSLRLAAFAPTPAKGSSDQVCYIMRLNLRIVLIFLSIAATFIIFGVYMGCSELHDLGNHFNREANFEDKKDGFVVNESGSASSPATALMQDIECVINQEYSINCKRNIADEVYVPFAFLRKYFDIYGVLTLGENNLTKFNWAHSNAKLIAPKSKYDPHGLFMYFKNYNVEIRDRVKCISASEGVPLSTQWEKRGYFYPTQIAQFALTHFSKNLTDPQPRKQIIEDADSHRAVWKTNKHNNFTRIWHPRFNTSVVRFETTLDFEGAISTTLSHRLDLTLSIDMLLVTNSSSLVVTLQNRQTNQNYKVFYILADLVISAHDDNIYYGLGKASINRWRHLTRDLFIDVQKGVVIEKKPTVKMRRNDIEVLSISFLGVGFFDNVTLSTYNHMAHFYDAAEWFVNNQDTKTGGWPNPIKRALRGCTTLEPGWLSAMGQGHAISVLSRAYWHSGGETRFLQAAALGLKPFRLHARDGGVLTQFMDRYDWYEEYPTSPASFVLNGFIYSLIGLYDLNATAAAGVAQEAETLFNNGMHSLKKMLVMYDTGSGSSYDLRHLSLGVAPNLARWDYHATHVNQLLLLATIDSDPIFAHTAERWKGYMFGRRAKHN